MYASSVRYHGGSTLNLMESYDSLPSGKMAFTSKVYSPSGRLLYSLVRLMVFSDQGSSFNRYLKLVETNRI